MNKDNQNIAVEKILADYVGTGKENSKLEELKALDRKVKRPANIFGYVFGTIGAIIMGSGMSIVMTDIGALVGENSMTVGIVVGVVGLVMAVINYPIYKKILDSRRKKYADQIIKLSNQIA